MDEKIPAPSRDYNLEIETANIKLQEIANLKDQLESENFAALWQDVTPSDWMKFLPMVSIVLDVVILIMIFFKK